jgi:hypothetical protein
LNFDFFPNAARAGQLDRAMHASLAASLEYVAEQADGQLRFDHAAVERVVADLRDHRFSPAVFGRYYRLVEAIEADDLSAAQEMLDRILAERPTTDRFALYSIQDIPGEGVAGLYHEGMDTDPVTRFDFLQPEPQMASAFAARLQSALARFEPVVPELIGEVRGIVSQVVLAVGAPGAAYQFDGGSSYQLWGALFLNPSFHPTEVDVLEVVAHESAHSLLFGFTVDEPLQLNADGELYASPLRVDPRPMDGIYHATFVSARMHWAMSQLLAADVLDEAERAKAESARAADLKNFEAGAGVVREHGRLTDTGRALFEGASAYMAQQG